MSFLCWQNVDFCTQYVTRRRTHLHTQEEQFNLPRILGILHTHTKCTPYAQNGMNKIWIANCCRCSQGYRLVMQGNYLVLTNRPSKMRKIVKESKEAKHRKDEDRTFRKINLVLLGMSRKNVAVRYILRSVQSSDHCLHGTAEKTEAYSQSVRPNLTSFN